MTQENENTNSGRSSGLRGRMNDLEFDLKPPVNRNTSQKVPSDASKRTKFKPKGSTIK